MESPHEIEYSPESNDRLEHLTTLAVELGFSETNELRKLHEIASQALRAGRLSGLEALRSYQIAAEAHVEAQDPGSTASIGYQIAESAIWLEAGRIDTGLDVLWDASYQAGQTPGIESLSEALEEFVMTYDTSTPA